MGEDDKVQLLASPSSLVLVFEVEDGNELKEEDVKEYLALSPALIGDKNTGLSSPSTTDTSICFPHKVDPLLFDIIVQ